MRGMWNCSDHGATVGIDSLENERYNPARRTKKQFEIDFAKMP